MTSPGIPDDHLDVQLDRLVHASRRGIIVILAALCVLVLGLLGVVTWLVVVNNSRTAANETQITAAIASSDHRWCAAMNLLTSVPQQPPANPAANPSREEGYQLYADFVTLRRQFGCG